MKYLKQNINNASKIRENSIKWGKESHLEQRMTTNIWLQTGSAGNEE